MGDTDEKKSRGVVSSNAIDGLTVMMGNALGGGIAHMITGGFEACTLDDPGVAAKYEVYNTVGTTDEPNVTDTCRVKSWVRSELLSRFPSRLCRNYYGRWRRTDDAFCRLIYRFTVNK